jgi:hypothetical protein
VTRDRLLLDLLTVPESQDALLAEAVRRAAGSTEERED